jgi:hypothetical protein
MKTGMLQLQRVSTDLTTARVALDRLGVRLREVEKARVGAEMGTSSPSLVAHLYTTRLLRP